MGKLNFRLLVVLQLVELPSMSTSSATTASTMTSIVVLCTYSHVRRVLKNIFCQQEEPRGLHTFLWACELSSSRVVFLLNLFLVVSLESVDATVWSVEAVDSS